MVQSMKNPVPGGSFLLWFQACADSMSAADVTHMQLWAARRRNMLHVWLAISALIESNAEHRWSKCLCTLAQHFKCGKRAADTGRFLSSTSSTKSQNGAKEGAKDGETPWDRFHMCERNKWVSLVNISLINIAAFTVSWSAFWQVKEQSHNLSQSCTKDTS